jgi:hypothetical protein
LFRSRPKLQASLEQELQSLRSEALDLEHQLQADANTEATA